MSNNKAIILDRDGVLIEDKNYSCEIKDLELLPGVIEGLKRIQKDFFLFIVTNQSGIAKGFYSIDDFHKYNNHLISILNNQQIKIEKTFFCPHKREDNCDCMKPKTKFLKEIERNWNLDLKKSWMIGDHPSDIQFGINGGCKTIYVITGHGRKHLKELEAKGISPTKTCSNFLEAVKTILK